jgi:Flp pilus assembly protein TadD
MNEEQSRRFAEATEALIVASTALDDARDALSVWPYSASAHLQEAVLLEDRGDLTEARDAAKAATEDEETNWVTWYVLARIEAKLGDRKSAETHWRHSHSLNPRSGVYSDPPRGLPAFSVASG